MPGKKIELLVLAGVLIFFMSGCAVQNMEADRMSPRKSAPGAIYEEQNEKAYEVFEQILDLSKAPDRAENLPEIKRLYWEIIRQYPEIDLAQECYLRLIIIARDEKSPAGDMEAEELYQEFLETYPDSRLKSIAEEKLKKTS